MKVRFLGILISFVIPFSGFSQGIPVFDVSNWLFALDQLYTTYDMVNNTITQIENQYKSIQQSIDRAKSIDWDNIRFDGDFDIRNDIRDANRRVNKLLNQARNIKTTITTPSINCGRNKYSIADLCGHGDDENKNILSAIQDYKNFMTEAMQGAVNAIVEGLDDDEKKAIWNKYGISPANYVFVQESTRTVKKKAGEILAYCQENVIGMREEERLARQNAIIQAAYETTDENGNPTEAALNEANTHLLAETNDGIARVEDAVNRAAAGSAQMMLAEENRRVAEANSAAQERETEFNRNSKVDSSFYE